MAANYKWIWIKIRRLDIQFETGSPDVPESLQQVLLPHVTEFEELKAMVYSWPGLTVDAQKVIKLRRHDGMMVPLSELYQGSSKEEPFILDVVNFYQSSLKKKETEKKEPTATETDLKEAFKHKLDQLEKRIQAAEKRGKDSTESHEEDIAESAKKLSETIDFLSRRIDELTPSEWKDQLKPS